MTASRYDSIVVGAGPAGASAARVLAENGQRVLLADIAAFPRPKACAGLMADGARSLVGAEAAAAVRARFACLLVRLGRGAPEEIAEPVVLVDRREFDHALLREAEAAGAEFRVIAGVGSIACEDGAALTTRDGQVFRARCLIGCDGAKSAVARCIGVRRIEPRPWAVVADIPLERCPPEVACRPPYLDFLAIENGYGWVFPKADRVSVGIGSVKPGRAIRESLEAFARRERLPVPTTVSAGLINTEPVAAPPRAPAVLLAGDAAGLADHFTGGGLHSALLSGRLAARAVLESEDRWPGPVYQRLLRPLHERLARQRRLAQSVFSRVPTDLRLADVMREDLETNEPAF